MSQFEENIFRLIRGNNLSLLVDMSKNNDQIKSTLMSTKCVHEAIENCTPESVESFLENIKVDIENCLSDDKETVFHFAALNEKSADMFAIMEKYSTNPELLKHHNLQLQTPCHYLLSNRSRCTNPDQLTRSIDMMSKYKLDFQAKSIHQNIAVDLLNKRMIEEMTKETVRRHILANSALNQKTEPEENHIEEINAMESDSESIENIETSQESPSNESGSNNAIPDLNQFNAQQLQQIQLLLQQQLFNYQLTQALYQRNQKKPLISINSDKKTTHQFKEPTVTPGDNRPSVYNRRISSEQIELPDGRICTRVPARKWSKRDPEWQLFQFECEFCPYFQDMRKYRRKAELVRHQALHFPDQARKFKCTMCAYSATRNEYLKSHMANRHNVIQTPPREKRHGLAQLQIQGAPHKIPNQMPLSESIKNLINSGSSSGLPMIPFTQQSHFSLSAQPLSIPRSLQSTSSISSSPTPSISTSLCNKVPTAPSTISDGIEIESCSSLYEKDDGQTEDGIISIDTVEAEEDTRSKFADFEKDQIMPQELFTN